MAQDKHYALAREAILAALTAYSGITTADGATPANNTLICADLIGENDFISNKTILIGSGDAAYEDSGASSFEPLTGAITVTSAFSAQIKAGTIFRVLNISSVEIDVEAINTKIGTNADAAGTTTLFAWLLKLFEQGGQGLVYYGEVTTYTDVTHFRVSGLTGFGDNYFANTYRVYVVWDKDGAGAAPQGEMQPCSDYDSTDGIFTHTAFTAPLEVGDKVLLIHERLAEIADILADIGDASASTLGSIYAILGNPATAIATLLGDVFGIVNVLLTLTETGGIFTATGAEQDVYINDAPAGVFKPLLVTIDLGDLAGGETATIRTYYRIRAGGTSKLKGAPVIFNGVQAEPMKDIELRPNRFGIRVTIQATATVVIEWEVHYEV